MQPSSSFWTKNDPTWSASLRGVSGTVIDYNNHFGQKVNRNFHQLCLSISTPFPEVLTGQSHLFLNFL